MKKYDYSFVATCFVLAVAAGLLNLVENDWQFTGGHFSYAMAIAFGCNVHFRVARLEKSS
jgi:hypothetical protein